MNIMIREARIQIIGGYNDEENWDYCGNAF